MRDHWAHFRRGGIYGARAWIIYGVVETALFSLGQLLFTDKEVVVSWHWMMTLRLLGAYVAIGFVAGGLGGVCVGLLGRKTKDPAAERASLCQSVGTLTLSLGYLINLFAGSGEGRLVPFAVGWILTLTIVAGMLSQRWRGRREVASEPWIAAALLLGTPWLAQMLQSAASTFLKAFVLVAFLVGLMALALAGRALLQPRMHLRYLSTVIAAAVAILAGVAVFNERLPTPSGAERWGTDIDSAPNVVLVVMDTVRADHMSLYGYGRETTPRLRQFTSGATLYERAVATSNFTLPTHASMFTGLYSRAHGSHYVGDDTGFQDEYGRPLADGFVTLAEILAAEGYATLGVAANYLYLAPEFGLSQGFDLFDARAPAPILRADRPHSIRLGVRRLLSLFSATLEFDRLTRDAEEVTEDALSMVDLVAGGSAPFFLFVNYMDAHEPYVPPAPFDSLFPGRDERFTHARYQSMLEEVAVRGEREVAEAEYDHFVSQYDGAIAYVDHAIGTLIERLRDIGLYENTLIIVTSDHGEAFGERSLIGHMASLYDNQVLVPLVVKYPGQTESVEVVAPVSHVDILPTVTEIVGLGAPDGLHGASLVAAGKTEDEREFVISEGFGNPYQDDTRRRFALVSRQWKLLSTSDGRHELYDLLADPEELDDAFNATGPAFLRLDSALKDWLDAVAPAVLSETELPEDVLERLRSLGYIR